MIILEYRKSGLFMERRINMITYDEALIIAKREKPNTDNCTEYSDAYVFSAHEDSMYIGGYGHAPIVIMKEDGKLMSFPEYIAKGSGEEERRFEL